MVRLPFFKTKSKINKESNIVAIDIGTEVLKTILFKVSPEGVETIKVARIEQQQNAMNRGIITNLSTVLENCHLALREISKDLNEADLPKSVVMGIAGEYVQGVSIVVNYEREVNFEKLVDIKEQEKIISKVHAQILQGGKEDLALRTGLTQEDIEILHITVTGMEIGGMPVDSLVGFKGKSVKLFFFASFAPKTYVSALQTVAKSLNLSLIGIVSQPFAIARAFAGAKSKDFSAIFIDIGGGTTDIAVLDQGNVIDTQMFAFGGRVFTKEIAREIKLDYRHAESRKIKYSQEELTKGVQGEVKKIMYPVAQAWMKTLKAAFEMNKEIVSFPPKIYLCGGGALLPEIKEVMMEFPWTKFLPFPTVPKISFFSPSKFEKLVDNSNDLDHIYDVTPTALTLFAYEKIFNPENFNA
ncbi:pilus assembly protein PilM [Candidatus Dojkabacteria bacterium]|jgi:cell division protein FtsA|nr:pilus assembly protein PilM [Candidatus Dojkabacteria bacterium]